MDIAFFGRDLELSAGRAFLAAAPARALLVESPAGIGKTAVWRALTDIARADGYLVLESIGDAAEARLTFAGLADLLGKVADKALAQLPAPRPAGWRSRCCAPMPPRPGEPRAVAAGLLGALRGLAAAELEAAAASYAELGLRFDRARVLLALGRAQRRLKKWAAARRSLELAAVAFDEIGSTRWAAAPAPRPTVSVPGAPAGPAS